MADNVDIMDFAGRTGPIVFHIYGEPYYACPDLPLGMMQRISAVRTKIATIGSDDSDDDTQAGIERMNGMLAIFDDLLLEESAAKFRMGFESKDKTIGIGVVMRLLPWLMEEYGLRPTQPSDPSSTGSGDDETGTPSTDIASQETFPS